MRSPLSLLRKIGFHLRLLRDEPEQFGLNLLQFSHPERFLERLLDVMTAAPLHAWIDPALRGAPAVNVLQPILSPESMTGGPNTIVNLAFQLARRGVRVRIVTTRPGAPEAWFWTHLASITGDSTRPPSLSVDPAHDPAHPIAIGPRDMFLATHWTTAQQAKAWLPRLEVRRMFYLIQDFEPGFYAWSSNHALALETYGLDHIGIFNERLLHDHTIAQGAGRYADPAFAAQALTFEPALDRALFHPPAAPRPPGRRRLLFYARPTNPRNMLGIGIAALRQALADPAFQAETWEFLAIGSRGSLPPLDLGHGHTLRPVPWADYPDYAQQLREADVLLCPMLSPHTSYPVLEMAASGGIAVTNSFATKTADALRALSANIVATPATIEGFTGGLVTAAQRVRDGVDIHAPLALPSDWATALHDVADQMARRFEAITRSA